MQKRYATFGVALCASAVLAGTLYGPFLFGNYFPTLNKQDDFLVSYEYSQAIPRLVMLTSVQSIKKGDNVRIIYQDGSIYDFPVRSQCSYVRSPSCLFGEPVPVPTPMSPSKINTVQIDYWDRDNCDPRHTVMVATGYWSGKVEQTGPSEFTQTATWVSTGDWPLVVGGHHGCK